MISELNGWPACALVNASPAMLPWPAHDSGPGWFASPFPCGSFIRYSMPVLTGAFPDPFSALFSARGGFAVVGVPRYNEPISSLTATRYTTRIGAVSYSGWLLDPVLWPYASMPDPQPDASRRPMPLRALLRVLAVLASSRLATVVITLSAVVLAWATWIESEYGTAAVGFGVYRSWWFAAAVGPARAERAGRRRRPVPLEAKPDRLLDRPRRHPRPSRRMLDQPPRGHRRPVGGVRGRSLLDGAGGLAAFPAGRSSPRHRRTATPETIEVPFQSGPFNWDDYASLGWFPWRLARRDQGTLLDRDGISLEVLDYYSDSRETPVPELTLAVGRGRAARKRDAEAWRSLVLAVRELRSPHMPNHPLAIGSREPMAEGQWVVFRMAASKAETDAFRDSRPEGPVGRLGQLVLHAGGKKHCLALEDLEGKPPVPLGTTGMKVELVRFDPASLRVHLRTFIPRSPTRGRDALAARLPHGVGPAGSAQWRVRKLLVRSGHEARRGGRRRAAAGNRRRGRAPGGHPPGRRPEALLSRRAGASTSRRSPSCPSTARRSSSSTRATFR